MSQKLIVGTVIEKRAAFCNFCGEKKESCFKAPIGVEVPLTSTEKIVTDERREKVIAGPAKRIVFGIGYRISDWNYRDVLGDYEYRQVVGEKTRTVNVDICSSCVKQLAKE